ncbi:MAG: hypothetical protein WDN49_14050 [Acetobacteraceae bacterium]
MQAETNLPAVLQAIQRELSDLAERRGICRIASARWCSRATARSCRAWTC